MVVTGPSIVNTTDTLETLRVQFNNLNSDVVTLDSTVSGSGSSIPADNITTGDVGASIATTSGNITIDAQASDADILFKGTDDASDITALQLDMSDAGKFNIQRCDFCNHYHTVGSDGGVIVPDDGNIGSASSTAAMQISSGGIVTFADDIKIKDGGTIGVASAAAAITIASTGIVTFVDDIVIKDGTIGSVCSTGAIGISSVSMLFLLLIT